MSKQYAKSFYNSIAWKKCREGFLETNPLCEECFKKGRYVPAVIVHHRKHITPENIGNASITLNWNNLEAVCHECHNEIHETKNNMNQSKRSERYKVDADGKVTIVEEK